MSDFDEFERQLNENKQGKQAWGRRRGRAPRDHWRLSARRAFKKGVRGWRGTPRGARKGVGEKKAWGTHVVRPSPSWSRAGRQGRAWEGCPCRRKKVSEICSAALS
uniref:Uncharacterized protein n=1 Tax=Pseudonaja textilis TaxID=8673 RepID=A0A670ZL81_PSETE